MGTREIHTRCLAAFFTCCMALAFAEPTAAQMMADTIEVRHLSIGIDEIGRESHGSENIYRRPAAFPPVTPVEAIADDAGIPLPSADIPQRHWSIYMEPYSWHGGLHPDWHRMWINTAVLSGAFSRYSVLFCNVFLKMPQHGIEPRIRTPHSILDGIRIYL